MVKTVVSGVIAVVAVGVAACAYAGGDCAGQAQKNEKAAASVSSAVVAAGTAAVPVNAGNKVCPVSGEKIGTGGMQPATYEHKGTIYNFCCASCIATFKQDPDKYVKKVVDELKAAGAVPAQDAKGSR